jgi:hypothetical protein
LKWHTNFWKAKRTGVHEKVAHPRKVHKKQDTKSKTGGNLTNLEEQQASKT